MLRPLRRLSGPLRRSLSTAASRPAWAMIYRISTAEESAASRGVSLALAPPPLASRVSVPRHAFGLDPLPATASTDGQPVNFFSFGSPALEQGSPPTGQHRPHPHRRRRQRRARRERRRPPPARHVQEPRRPLGDVRVPGPAHRPVRGPRPGVRALLLLRHHEARALRLQPRHRRDGPPPGLRRHGGRLHRLHGPPHPGRRRARTTQEVRRRAAQRGRRWAAFPAARLSSETGEWDELVLPSPLPAGRLMHMNHEVLDFGGRLWWVDVSWGAVNVDPFSDRPELCLVELPGDIMLADQQGETEMSQVLQYRRMGVSDGRLRLVDVSKDEPFLIKSFTLDDNSGRWMLEHQVSWRTLCPEGKAAPLIAAIDPLSADLVYLTVPVGNGFCVSVDMRWKRPIECVELGSGVHPSKCISSFVLPCVLPSFLGSSPIPDMHPQRLFSSARSFRREQIPVVRQLLFNDEYEVKKERWCSFEEMLVKGSMLKTLVPTGLIRLEDIRRNGNYITGNLGVLFLRDLAALATVNLMRGVNISELMLLENLLWAPSARGIMFKHTDLVNNGEESGCPYLSIYELFKLAVLITTGKPMKEVNLPADLSNFLQYLQRATYTDKRLITNHSATRFPEERIQRNKSYNYLLRNEFRYFYDKPAAVRGLKVLKELGRIFPPELLAVGGLHPLIDYWASYDQETNGLQSGSGVILTHQRPIVLPRFGSFVELGNLLVALWLGIPSNISMDHHMLNLSRTVKWVTPSFK